MLNKDLPTTMRCGRFVISFHCSGEWKDVTTVVKRAMWHVTVLKQCALIVIILAMKADNALAHEDVVFVNVAII